MDLLLIAIAAAVAAALTLFSGFGLGTILLPVFALFFPIPIAVAATGVIHLLNNLFKAALLWKRANWRTVVSFGVPAIPAAILGAWLLVLLGDTPQMFEWSAFGRRYGPTGAGLVVGILMIALGLLELQGWFQKLSAPRRLVPLGGLLSGFFGGLAGQQGALRSIFLLRTGLAADQFIATGVMIAVLIDVSRLATYAASFGAAGLEPEGREVTAVAIGASAAFAGAYLATRYLDKLTIAFVRWMVAALMILIGAASALGLVG